MINQLVPTNWHASLPAHLRTPEAMQEMASLGAAFESRAFARISTSNNTFSIVNLDGEMMKVNQMAEGAVYLDLAFIKWAPHITKTWYDKPYVDGSELQPACFSMDGQRPDPSSSQIQHPTCAACPKNAFGSASNGSGKACQDGQRTAIVLGADTPVSVNGAAQVIKAGESVYGFKLPPMTGKNLAAKRKEFEKAGVNLMGVVLRATFVSQGVIDFKAIAYLGEKEWLRTRELAKSDEAERACGLDQIPAKTLPATPAYAPLEAPKPEAVFIAPTAAVPQAPIASPVQEQSASPRRRGRPPTPTASAPPVVPTSASSVLPSAAPPAVPSVVPSQNGVIQAPIPSSSELDDMLAKAMA